MIHSSLVLVVLDLLVGVNIGFVSCDQGDFGYVEVDCCCF